MSTVATSLSQCPSCASSAAAVVSEFSDEAAVCIQCGCEFHLPWYSRLLHEAASALPDPAAEIRAVSDAVRPWKLHSLALIGSLIFNTLVLLILSLLWLGGDTGRAPLQIEAVLSVAEQEPLQQVEALLAGGDQTEEASSVRMESTVMSLDDLVTPSPDGKYALPAGVAGLAGHGGGTGGGGAGLGPGASLFRDMRSARSYAFVVDASGSMQGLRMKVVLQQLNQSINALEDDQSFFVVFFSDRAFPMCWPQTTTQLIQATAVNRNYVLNWANGVEPDGGTKPHRALRMALELRPEVVFFLTDGSIPDTTDRLAKRYRASQTRINTICIGGNATRLMQRIATESGGSYTGIR